MFRDILLGIVSGLLILSMLAWWLVGSQVLGPMVFLVLLLAALAFENRRYKLLHSGAPGDGWTKTAEQFVDPETGQPVQVWYNAATGDRRYVTPPKSN